uniref:MARVEL domain-containing protein n=2 Tax=Felis catus TaxID=9685 RepID=A0ABI7W468_FELCA
MGWPGIGGQARGERESEVGELTARSKPQGDQTEVLEFGRFGFWVPDTSSDAGRKLDDAARVHSPKQGMESPTGCSGTAIKKVSRVRGECGRLRRPQPSTKNRRKGSREPREVGEEGGRSGRERDGGGAGDREDGRRGQSRRGGEGRGGGGAAGGCSPALGSRLFLLPHCLGFRFPPGRGVRERGRASVPAAAAMWPPDQEPDPDPDPAPAHAGRSPPGAAMPGLRALLPARAYLCSLKGRLLLAESGLSFITFVCYVASSASAFLAAPLLEFLLALYFLFADAMQLNDKWQGLCWPMMDFLRCVTAALIYFAISITAVAKYSDGASKAAGVFGFFATIVFAIDFYLIFNDVAKFLKQGDTADENTADKAEEENSDSDSD